MNRFYDTFFSINATEMYLMYLNTTVHHISYTCPLTCTMCHDVKMRKKIMTEYTRNTSTLAPCSCKLRYLLLRFSECMCYAVVIFRSQNGKIKIEKAPYIFVHLGCIRGKLSKYRKIKDSL